MTMDTQVLNDITDVEKVINSELKVVSAQHYISYGYSWRINRRRDST